MLYLAIQPRTLEVLEFLGLREKIERRGTKICEYAVHVRTVDKSLKRHSGGLEVVPPTSYPCSVIIDKGDVEENLEGRLQEKDHSVRRGAELIHIYAAQGAKHSVLQGSRLE
jgi:2-polyprenyl-6-methoxyphenol hydroxylase-like FAD-dependent oxidoreductase